MEDKEFDITEVNTEDIPEYCPKCGAIMECKSSGIVCTKCNHFECF